MPATATRVFDPAVGTITEPGTCAVPSMLTLLASGKVQSIRLARWPNDFEPVSSGALFTITVFSGSVALGPPVTSTTTMSVSAMFSRFSASDFPATSCDAGMVKWWRVLPAVPLSVSVPQDSTVATPGVPCALRCASSFSHAKSLSAQPLTASPSAFRAPTPEMTFDSGCCSSMNFGSTMVPPATRFPGATAPAAVVDLMSSLGPVMVTLPPTVTMSLPTVGIRPDPAPTVPRL